MAIKTASQQGYDIEQIIAGITQPDIKAILYFFSPAFEKNEPQKAIAKAFPGAACVGASMIGGWSNFGAVETGITAMSFSSAEVEDAYVSFQEGVKEDPAKAAKAAIEELKQKTAGHNINPDEYLGLIFFDGLCLGELIMKEFSLDHDLNLAFIGGAAADELSFTKTLVGAGDKLSGDGLVAVILRMNIPFFFDHYVHYLPTENSFTITRVETMKRIAWEINGEPAAVFYARQIGIDDVNKLDSNIFSKHPVGLNFGGSVYVRSPNSVVDGKGLQFYCYIETGTKVCLLKQGDIIAHAGKSLAASEQFLPAIQGGLLFNCVLRYLELRELGKINDFNNVFSNFPMIGFNTYGEELFTHHNQTLTAVFFGTHPEAGAADPYKAKRLFYYTNSKLKSMVFDMVSRSELLLLTISSLKNIIDSNDDEKTKTNYNTLKETLESMIGQSKTSKEDIENMLKVYQSNVEKTGSHVYSIVDEIRTQNQRLVELKEKAEAASRTKSNFLASMSHEIRTPMNAISGMAELLLREELSTESRGYVEDIKNASTNLLSIINDLLDFSKIEAGKLEIIPAKYHLSSIINDVVNIIRTRLAEKPVRLVTNIDGNIPNSLVGDEVRMRQILLNILSNGVKYTERGHIIFTIVQEKQENEKVWLKISVTDTGYGIKIEDQEKLFGDFVRVGTKQNSSIEGTGLGLAITKRLCLLMGGDISCESEYGRGSVFTAFIPQGINEKKPFAVISEAEKKKVLVYEGRSVYAKSIHWSLENMNVPHTVVDDIEAFTEAINREEWAFVFSGLGLHNKIDPVLKHAASDSKKMPVLALMADSGAEVYIPGAHIVSLPIHALSIANILNGKTDSGLESAESKNVQQFSIPRARLLVVDDIATNLKVAEGLLAPYQAVVDSCQSGAEAIDLVSKCEYDIIFMDHMMPEMDGIEAAGAIRAMEGQRFKTVPIIALTANAISGMKEMFIEKGFNDFLAKPIDIAKLDGMLVKWIAQEKREKGKGKRGAENKEPALTVQIPGVDVQRGIVMTGGTSAGYIKILSMFCKDAEERLAVIQTMPDEDSLKTFVTQVHALKSVTATIGAEDVSGEAAALEAAGKARDFDTIKKNLESFSGSVKELMEKISVALEEIKTGAAGAHAEKPSPKKKDSESQILMPLFHELASALQTQNIAFIDRILADLDELAKDAKTKTALENISDEVLMSEYGKAKKLLDEFLNDSIK